MKIKCKYCLKEFEDTNDACPYCGEKVEKEIINTKKPPRTIDELKAWYKAKNLPPYEVTRFFIGQNHVGPRAFGIYQDEDNFIVYKNKADGKRTIRYEGPDEAKAVNELYLRLKQEISNQKNVNIKNKQKKIIKWILIGVIAFVTLITTIIGISIHKSNVEYSKKPHDEYYWYNNTMYYCDDRYGYYDWWIYDNSLQDYKLYKTTDDYNKKHPEESFVDGMNNDNSIHSFYPKYIYDELYPKGLYRDRFQNKYDIDRSRNYIDAGHHYPPYENGYYTVDNNVYYYLDDYYSYYSDYDSGWYIYDNGNWIYYADPYNQAAVGDYLWYTPYDYYVGETIADYITGYYDGYYDGYYNQNEWTVDNNVSDFEDTDYYTAYEDAYDIYEEELEAEKAAREESDYWDDYDSDSSWDSSDSWDSGSTDWGSDW